jgi:AcrR family transcriptional regulator
VEVVLDAAAQVLTQRGYAAATTNRIAAAAGVSVGTVYEYFASKDGIFEALIQRELKTLVLAFSKQEFEPSAPIETAFRSLIAAGIGAMRYGPELFRALEAVPDATFRRQLAGARTTVVGLVENLLEAHRDELCVEDPGLAAFIVVSSVEGVAANATRADLDVRLERELTTLVTRYLTGSG